MTYMLNLINNKKKMKKFKRPQGRTNNIISYESEESYDKGFYVSINKSLNETALCYDGKFFILNGILQKEVEKCKTFLEVVNLFLKSDLEISGYSDFYGQEQEQLKQFFKIV